MATSIEVAGVLVQAGYLSPDNTENAVVLLAKHLSVADQESYEETEANSSAQEQMIAKAKPYVDQDVEYGDRKNYEVDEDIIKSAYHQDEVDLMELHSMEKRISRQAKKAARSLVSAGLVEKKDLKAVTNLIVSNWI